MASISAPGPRAARALARALIEHRRGALFVVNHSGGKDSQAMTLIIAEHIDPRQLIVVHAALGRVEWPGTITHIRATIPRAVPLLLATATRNPDLLDRVRERKRWPSPRYRYCTSDLKRGPIEREVRRYLAANPRFAGRIVNCMGMRGDESPKRALGQPWHRVDRNCAAGREWYEWRSLHDTTENEVFALIAKAGQSPHWAYRQGMRRLSCSFCFFASRADLRTARVLRPDLYETYRSLEREINHTHSSSGEPLDRVTAPPPTIPEKETKQ